MILVDIYFPAIDTVYDVKVDEHSEISLVIKEIGEMICKKYKSEFSSANEYMLCSKDIDKILESDKSLAFYHIKNGGSLVLV